MSTSAIESMYQAQYDARQKEYEKAKRKQLEQLALEEKQYENAFNSTKQQIDMNRTNTKNKYTEMYNQLQNRYAEGKKGFTTREILQVLTMLRIHKLLEIIWQKIIYFKVAKV